MLEKVKTIPWMVLGDHRGHVVQPYILGTVGDTPDDGGQPSWDRWVTLLGMVDDHPGDGW